MTDPTDTGLDLRELHRIAGAKVADDGIPLQYHDLITEYRAALDQAVLLDRSHEGRLQISGGDRHELLHRMSTNEMHNMQPDEGRPTIFTNANARIVERAEVYNRDSLLLVSGPGRGGSLRDLLQRNIFFRDDAKLHDLTPTTRQIALHGPKADAIIEALHPGSSTFPLFRGTDAIIAEAPVYIARRKPLSASHWIIIAPAESAARVWNAVLEAGQTHGLIAAGSLTYNTLRIRAGEPGQGRELSLDYIPLELGLWDEVSFTKGCYTGQEIIARMESRGRLAKTIVQLQPEQMVSAPAEISHEGKRVGMLTSSVSAPDGELFAVAVVRPSVAAIGTTLMIGTVPARVTGLPGSQPPTLMDD